MTIKFFLNVIFLIALAVFQVSFINNLPGYFSYLNSVLIVLLFILELRGLGMAFWWAIGLGLIFDLFSFNFFGIFIISFILSVYFTYFLLSNFFTDFSIYSISLLSFFLLFFYEIILLGLNSLMNLDLDLLISLFSMEFLKYFFIKILINLLVIFIVFHITNFFNNKFSPVFLEKKR